MNENQSFNVECKLHWNIASNRQLDLLPSSVDIPLASPATVSNEVDEGSTLYVPTEDDEQAISVYQAAMLNFVDL